MPNTNRIKAPRNLPMIGERCKLRGIGRNYYGILRATNERNWAQVDWDIDSIGPTIVHLWELESVRDGIT